jgi:subfamily B ATP-binding cassette protein MsbA
MTLSGGQRQRIAIARALIRDSPILVLDEASTGLDAASERLVFDALNVLMKGKTSIVIAHKLSTIRSADVIFVVNDGEIVERGNHIDLLKLGGLYAELHELQFWGEETRTPLNGLRDKPFTNKPTPPAVLRREKNTSETADRSLSE